MKPHHEPGDATGPRRGGRLGFAVRVKDIRQRADVNYAAGTKRVNDLYAATRYPLEPLGSFARELQYGTSALASSEETGVPILRMNNLQDDGWDLSDLKYIDLPESELTTYRLNDGDILFNRTNSKELVGKCAVFREAGVWVFASYLIRVTLDHAKALPDFVSMFLNTSAGRAQIDRLSRQIIGMTNINAEEIRTLLVPLPPPDDQRAMIAELLAARDTRDRRIAQADDLLRGLDDFLLDSLGLDAPPDEGRSIFAVRHGDLRGKRLDPPAYRPLLVKGKAPRIRTKPLAEVAYIDNNVLTKKFKPDDLVPYIGLPECSQTEVREVALRPYSEVKGRGIVRAGDILFARIEPSVFNKKYVLADNLHGHEFAFTSTEFYTVRPNEEEVSLAYIYAMFFCSFVFAQVKGKTTGSSGRRRIDSDLFAGIRIPVAEPAVQKKITAEVIRRRESAIDSRQKAADEWAAAKEKFQGRLLGGGK